ncbi:hypothetical protein CC85DRAFT_303533 [Cutaneotrichosporon oleaginosum]|uniref:Xylanolytic transcriptional activator regulatory domain-containing protein n=1 Tax=Cutaneotrichosporon oleaginosum TaxID=879819 RepID=A0A0J0XJ49_9TREE|nr:uncharacterized protein CC85DRAFT_303533 [Cutaneotrichosporon oleaginosum]KLT41091.1 hypothetical protein CC85DRAFT_303533 [Cutaneotrichosporon oleaginosum]TXT05776.1 hypothetical protein COLE_07096 [Cutaneotrichosporon oleaginosum]
MKCDRQVPCAHCVRRRCSDICPDGVQTDGLQLLSEASNRHRHRGQASDDHDGTPAVQSPARASTSPPRSASSSLLPIMPGVTIPAVVPDLVQSSSTNSPSFSFLDPASWRSVDSAGAQLAASHEQDGSGTLLMANGGRSKYLGPNASSEWLRDQETREPDDVPAPSRVPSPKELHLPGLNPSFPFLAAAPTTMAYLTSKLPPREEAKALAHAYFRYFAWQYDVAPRAYFEPIFERVYAAVESNNHAVNPQQLALLFIVFAMGALYSLELPPNDPAAAEYHALSKACLVKGNFLVNTAISGVQTLHIMAHFHLETEEGRNGDPAWPLWGLAMRIAQAMGLHRDGESWGLPPDVIEERRHVFWESNAADIFQANNFCRPCSISPDYVDTKLPKEKSSVVNDGRGYFTLKWELAVICGQVLDLSMKIKKPLDSGVPGLHRRLTEFESSIPYPLRCRSALLALPSRYADSESAIRDSPEQCTLAINVSEAFLFLHRPNFVKVLREQHDDPTKSPYAQSFFSILERCNVMIVVAATVHSLFPAIAVRHWFFWHHTFNSAVTMGTLIIRNPQNTLAPYALTLIDSTILLLSRVIVSWPSPRMAKNLKWLHRLRGRAAAKLSAVTPNPNPNPAPAAGTDSVSASDDEDVELVGWCTRLVQRGATGSQTVRTILSKSAPSPNVFSSPSTELGSLLDAVIRNANVEGGVGGSQMPITSPSHTDPNTDTLLHEFWDPMLMMVPSDNLGFTSGADSTWWEFDAGSGALPEQTE